MRLNSKINAAVFLNHAYAIINDSTYKAVKESSFLKNEFCHCDKTTVHSDTWSWTGIYLTGESTYIEFFNQKYKKQLQQDLNQCDVGIAFSTDHEDEFDTVVKIFEDKNPRNINRGLFKRNLNNNMVPWFYYAKFVK